LSAEADNVWVELVRTETTDGLRLDGALETPPSPVDSPGAPRGVICLHGVGSNFYGSTMMESLAQALLELGLAVLRVNTRGHDGVSTASTSTGGRLQGAAYEIVDQCRLDVEAWAEFLVRRGYPRLALLGHSLGALKAVYSQAQQPHSAVVRVIAISPPRLACSRFEAGPDAAAYRASRATAQRWLDAGQPQMLFPATFPFPLVLSAATFMDKYGPEERYNIFKLARQLRTPVDFIYGQQELDAGSSAFEGIVDDIQSAPWSAAYTLKVIPEANHFYAGCVSALIDAVRENIGKIEM
jgi:pimeloyl-ACP methyl ester carboxylesterase